MLRFRYGVVITGSIGSGKSQVCEILSSLGYEILSADKISHEILDENSDEIAKIFGSNFIINSKNQEKKVDRKALGGLVFSDKNALLKLENLLHPKIRAEILRRSSGLEKKSEFYFVEIPLFFESKNYKEFKSVLVVYASLNTMLSRVMQREKLTKDEALVRINSQIDIEKKRALANFVIDNSSDLANLKAQILEFLENLKDKKADDE